MSNGYFTLTQSKHGNLECGSKSFDGVDPVPGEVKGCYCDEQSSMYSDQETEEIK
jgi:hypothetical protein